MEQTTEQLVAKVTNYKTHAEFAAEEPTYDESLELSRFLVGFPGNEIEGEDALRLISLTAKLTVLYRTKNPEVKPAHILAKAYGKSETKGALKQYRQISLLTELFITPNAKFSMHGFKSVDEMFEEIRRIMDLWLPF